MPPWDPASSTGPIFLHLNSQMLPPNKVPFICFTNLVYTTRTFILPMHYFHLYMGILQNHLKSVIINYRTGLQGHFQTQEICTQIHIIIFHHPNYIFDKWQLKYLKTTFMVESFIVQILLQFLVGQQQAEGSITLYLYKLKEKFNSNGIVFLFRSHFKVNQVQQL